MIKEYIVKVTDEVLPDAFKRFEDDWSPEELVRCKNCKYGEPCQNGHGQDSILCTNSEVSQYCICLNPNWFCADGEI